MACLSPELPWQLRVAESDTLGVQDRLGKGQRRSMAWGRGGQEGEGAVGTRSGWRGGDPVLGKPCGHGFTTQHPLLLVGYFGPRDPIPGLAWGV